MPRSVRLGSGLEHIFALLIGVFGRAGALGNTSDLTWLNDF